MTKTSKSLKEHTVEVVAAINAANPNAKATKADIRARPGRNPNWVVNGHDTIIGEYEPVDSAVVANLQALNDLLI